MAPAAETEVVREALRLIVSTANVELVETL